jgi:hypothetical protein
MQETGGVVRYLFEGISKTSIVCYHIVQILGVGMFTIGHDAAGNKTLPIRGSC